LKYPAALALLLSQPVVSVGLDTVGQVLVVAGNRIRLREEVPPGQGVRAVVRGKAIAVVLVVAERQHGDRVDRRQQVVGRLLHAGTALPVAIVEVVARRIAGDVACGRDHRIAGGRRGLAAAGPAHKRDGTAHQHQGHGEHGPALAGGNADATRRATTGAFRRLSIEPESV